MDFLAELDDLPSTAKTKTLKTANVDPEPVSLGEFESMSIFQKETPLATTQHAGASLNLLGINSSLIQNVMNRLNNRASANDPADGSDQSEPEQEHTLESQLFADTQEETTTKVHTETQIFATRPIFEDTQPVSTELPEKSLGMLFVESDEEDEQITVCSRPANESDVEERIENYQMMTREEKIQARALEKKRQREEAERQERQESQEMEKEKTVVEVPVKKVSKKSEETAQLAELVKQNELIKKSNFVIKKQDTQKFGLQRLIDGFDKESDEEDNDKDDEDEEDDDAVFSHQSVENTPNSSPRKPNDVIPNKEQQHFELPSKLLQNVEGDVIELDSDSDDDINEVKFSTSKKTVFELKHRLSKKTRKAAPKTKTIKTLLQEEKIKQLKEFTDKRRMVAEKVNEDHKDDDEILKLLHEEMERNKKIRKQEMEKEARKAVLLKRQLAGENASDESEYSDYGSDGANEADDSDVESEDAESGNTKPAETKNLTVTKEIQHSDGEDDQPSITFDLGGAVGGNSIKQMSLSDVFAQTLPVNTSFEGLGPLEVAKKLREQNGGKDETFTEMNDDTTISHSEIISPENSIIQSRFKFLDDDDDDDEEDDDIQASEKPVKTILESQNFLPDTQVDSLLPTQPVKEIDTIQEEEDEDEQDEEDEEDEEVKQLRIRKIKEAKKLQEKRRRQRQREMRSKGLNQMMENEAVESEDEWHGMGGAEGESSDGENSEDEKMLDDGSNITVDEDKIRAALIKNEVEADDNLVKKIFKDIKTGAFRKRRAKEGAYELDLSDDEDDQILRYYNNRRAEFQRQQLMKNKGIKGLAKDENSKAFFETIVIDDSEKGPYQFEEPIVSDGDQQEGENERKREMGDDDDDEDEDEVIIKPKKRKITREQVRSMISFLDEDDNGHLPQNAILLDSDDDGFEELRSMRESSEIRMIEPAKSKRVLTARTNQTSNAAVELDSDSEIEGFGILASRSTSVTASFKSSKDKKFKMSASGKAFQEVNVVTSSKQTFNSKGSVTFLTNKKPGVVMSAKVNKIEQQLQTNRKKGLRKLFNYGSFL